MNFRKTLVNLFKGWSLLRINIPTLLHQFLNRREWNTADIESISFFELKDEKEIKKIEQLSLGAEMLIEEDDERKDLKEKRGIIKQTLFDGPHKLKHMIPKGKHL